MPAFSARATSMVNSVHRQGVDRLGERLEVEAVAEDGTRRGGFGARCPAFAVGVQWHPEYWAKSDDKSARIFRAFGDAVRAHAAARRSGASGSRVAAGLADQRFGEAMRSGFGHGRQRPALAEPRKQIVDHEIGHRLPRVTEADPTCGSRRGIGQVDQRLRNARLVGEHIEPGGEDRAVASASTSAASSTVLPRPMLTKTPFGPERREHLGIDRLLRRRRRPAPPRSACRRPRRAPTSVA